jgi:hypothetical protein
MGGLGAAPISGFGSPVVKREAPPLDRDRDRDRDRDEVMTKYPGMNMLVFAESRVGLVPKFRLGGVVNSSTADFCCRRGDVNLHSSLSVKLLCEQLQKHLGVSIVCSHAWLPDSEGAGVGARKLVESGDTCFVYMQLLSIACTLCRLLIFFLRP